MRLYRNLAGAKYKDFPNRETSSAVSLGVNYLNFFAKTPRVGFEPTTNRLTADRSTTELPRIAHRKTS